jgi:hypothetical protein
VKVAEKSQMQGVLSIAKEAQRRCADEQAEKQRGSWALSANWFVFESEVQEKWHIKRASEVPETAETAKASV